MNEVNWNEPQKLDILFTMQIQLICIWSEHKNVKANFKYAKANFYFAKAKYFFAKA